MVRKNISSHLVAENARLKRDLKKLKEELEKVNERFKEIDRQKDEFISVAAHELRAPATAIKGYLSMVLGGDVGDISEKARGFLTDASAVNDRLIRLVNNMLNVTRIERGHLAFQMERVDLAKVAQEVFYNFRFEAERKGLEFSLNIPDGIKDEVWADPDRIREVIDNLVSNAVKFTEAGRVAINIVNPKKSRVCLEVVDTGPGISHEEQEKLFRKFYRAEATEGKTMGTGLGLYISKLFVEKFNGKIGLKSEFSKGSNFWFELPLLKNK